MGMGGSCCCQVPLPGVTSFPCIPDFAPACPRGALQPRVQCQIKGWGSWDMPRAREGHGWINSEVFSNPWMCFGNKRSSCACGEAAPALSWQAPQKGEKWGTAGVQSLRMGTQKPERLSLIIGFRDNLRPLLVLGSHWDLLDHT